MLDIGDGQLAQHQGQGSYAIADIQRDLNGQALPFGQYAVLQANRHVQVPSQTMSLGMQLGYLMDYAEMKLGELFAAYRRAILVEFAADDGEPQHAAVDDETDIFKEINSRNGSEPFFRALLAEDHPALKFRGALGLKRIDPIIALRAFTQLYASGAGAAAGIPTDSLLEMLALKKRGIVG